MPTGPALPDPWLDPTLLARRAAARALVRGLLVGDDLDAAEVAVLTVVDERDAHRWAAQAAERAALGCPDVARRADASPERAAFERFAASVDQVHDRAVGTLPVAAQGVEGEQVRAEIGWWLGHRWSRREDAGTARQVVADALARVCGVGAGPVRTGLLAGVVALSDVLALPVDDLDDLDDLVGAHLGIPDPVTAAMVHDLVAGATWSVQDGTLVLAATSAHPALEVALDRAVERVRQVAVEVLRAAPELAALPLRARASVAAGPGPDGAPGYVGAGARFHLAEDRIRELLMGENLYGDASLALREAYQNAVDACRHREAREEYLVRTGGAVPVGRPEPAVRFVQDADAAGEFIDCTDTGVGMGLTEIAQAFCQAGVRAGDLPENVAELADMAALDPPVALHTNSRFGIGALSYFMLASAVTLTTTRLRRDGTLGHTYRVRISSPETYFRIEDLGPGTAPGTTVRLHLRGDARLSVAETLRGAVAVAAYSLVVRDALTGAEHAWEPGELGGDLARQARRPVGSRVPVWWSEGWYAGRMLADGLLVENQGRGTTAGTGAVVLDLTGPHAPRLSVDRTTVLDHDRDHVRALVRSAVPDLVADLTGPAEVMRGWDARDLTSWLRALAEGFPQAADDLLRLRAEAGAWPVEFDRATIDLAVTGVPDGSWALFSSSGTDRRHEWQVSALLAGGLAEQVGLDTTGWPEVRPVLPSDHVLLLDRSVSLPAPGTEAPAPSTAPLATLVGAAVRSGLPLAEVAARYADLGYLVPSAAQRLELDAVDRALVRHDEVQRTPAGEPITPIGVLRLAQALKLDVAEVVARLDALGHDVTTAAALDPHALAQVRLGSAELDAACRSGGRRAPWKSTGTAIPALDVLVAAYDAARPVAAVRDVLDRVGYRVDPEVDRLVLDERDRTLLRECPRWEGEPVVPVQWVQDAAIATGSTLRATADRLVELGLEVDPVPEAPLTHPQVCRGLDRALAVSSVHVAVLAGQDHLPEDEVRADLVAAGFSVVDLDFEPDEVDVRLAVTEYDDGEVVSVRQVGAVVRTPELVGLAFRTRLPVPEAARRLVRLGYRVQADLDALPPVDRASTVLVSRYLEGSLPWIDPDAPIGAGRAVLAAWQAGLTVAETVDRYRAIGLVVHDPREVLPVVRPGLG
jgi:hypothetical protein